MRDNQNLKELLVDLKSELTKLYGHRFIKLILYGSHARSEETIDSDIDIAVVLKGDIVPGVEIDNMVQVITDLDLKYGELISVFPVSENNFLNLKSPLLINVRREGVSV